MTTDVQSSSSVVVETDSVAVPEEDGLQKMPVPLVNDSSVKSRKWWLVGGVVLGALIIFAIAFPITFVWHKNQPNADNDPIFSLSTSPFETNLCYVSENMTNGFASKDEIANEIGNAAYFLLNQVVKRNTGVPGYQWVGHQGSHGPMDMMMSGREYTSKIETDASMGGADQSGSQSAPNDNGVGNDVTDYGTNNQEEEVEEGDVVVSDGDLVYAAYGDILVVWDARNGSMISQLQMPTMNDFAQGVRARGDWYDKPRILSLLLHDHRLLVTVAGYGPVVRSKLGREPIIADYLSTQLRLYSTESISSGRLQLIGRKNVNGLFQGVRVIDGKAHMMTTSSINAYTDLISNFDRYRNFPRSQYSNSEYVDIARRLAPTHVSSFTSSLMEELTSSGSLERMSHICIWQNEPSGTGIEELMFREGAMASLAQIHSLDLKANSVTLLTSTSSTFIPSSWAEFYGATDALVIAGQGWEFSAADGRSQEATYLVGFGVDGASSAPRLIGKVDGYLLNKYSLDVVGNVLRVATSIRNTWRFGPSVSGDVATAVAADGVDPQLDSTTQNYVILLEMPGTNETGAGTMNELGRIRLGKPNELFTAVRFFDNVSYAVTFERIDPLYVLDLSDPTDPSVIAELNITGFSSYLQSMNEDNTLLLALGQEADGDGMVLGVAITVFDVRHPTKPKASARYVIERDRDEVSYSDSLIDFKSVRYAGERLIIPVDTHNFVTQEEFHGFVTYKVNATHIEKECEISYADPEEFGDYCYYCAYLPPRSMIFDGNLVTMKDHFVRSNTLNDCSENWAIDIVVDYDSSNSCCERYNGQPFLRL